MKAGMGLSNSIKRHASERQAHRAEIQIEKQTLDERGPEKPI